MRIHHHLNTFDDMRTSRAGEQESPLPDLRPEENSRKNNQN